VCADKVKRFNESSLRNTQQQLDVISRHCWYAQIIVKRVNELSLCNTQQCGELYRAIVGVAPFGYFFIRDFVARTNNQEVIIRNVIAVNR